MISKEKWEKFIRVTVLGEGVNELFWENSEEKK
jgi:hypothetical protein